MAQEDNLHKLYINLTDDGYNLGTEDEFRKQLQNKATAEKFHQNMVDDGYQLGSFDEFVSMNGLSYQMPQSQLPADQVERRVQTARVPQPGERIEATHVDKDGNVLQTDTTQLVRGKVATVEIGTPQFTPPSSHEGEELARRNGYYNTKESLDDSFSYRPNEYGEMRYGWQRGQRIKQLNRTGLEFMNRTGAYDENYDQAASQAEKMSDAQLVAEFNKLSGQIADAEALAGTADGYAMATVLRAYSHELRARDIGFAHGSENKKGIGQYQAAKQDPAVAAEILKQEAMSPEQRKAYLANAYKHIMAGEEGAPDIAMLAGTMIHAKESGIFPEEAYSQVVGIINNEHAEDVLAGALQSADAEIERLSQLIEQRTQQLYAEDEAEGMSLAKVMQHAESGSGAPIFNQRLLNDPELSMLWTAKRAAERRKKVIERKQDNHGFMRQFIGTFWDTATDINTWDFGIQDMRDAVNLVSFGNNKGSDAPMERAREAMLQNTVDAQEAEQRWRLSAAQRWGVIGGQALPFVAEFIGTGGGFSGVRQGVTKGVTSFLEKSLGKAASSKAAQWLVRSTGMLTGDIASALLMTNTTGSMKTYADILDRKTGDLMQLYDGTFVFRNSTTMGDAILKGEVANTLEYYTEMLGNHLDGLISGAGKRLGLSRLSEGMKWLTGRQIQQLTTNVLRQGGINELPSEILEEEANLILNAMLVGDNNFSTGPLKELANKFGCNFEVDPNSEDYQRSIFNPETQADIWGGMLFSIGAMRAPSVAIGTAGQGWNTANYYYYKHKTDVAGTKLYGLVGGDELLDRINNTTNDQIPSLVAGILADDEFTPDIKSLAMDYIGNLVKERGYNVRMFDNAKDLDPEQDQEEGETVDLSYQEGYNAADEEQSGVKERVDVARAWLYNLGFDDSNIASLDSEEIPEAWLDALDDEQRAAVEEYRNAMAAYDGMLQHVQDDVDTAIAESDAAVDQQTHPETGAVHHAVLKTGGEVWVVGGNVALTPEGNIDIENSDGDLIVLDPATGGKRMIHVSDLASADEPLMADQLKEEAASTIQESAISDASNRIDGVLPFQPGDVYTLPFDDGQEHTITVIGDAGDGVNIVASVDGGEQQLMPMQMIQGAADQQREARIAEQAAMEAAAGAATQETAEPVEEEQPEEEVTEEQPAEDAMPMNGDEVDWFATSPERGHRFLYDEAGLSPEEADAVVANSVKDAEKELEKVSKKAPKPGNAAQLNKYRAEKEAHEQQVAAAQAAVDYWKGVQGVQQQIVADLVRRQADERAAQDAAARQAAIEAEQQYQAEQAAKQQEQAERGPGVAGQNIIDKWNAAKKIYGRKDVKVLADGSVVSGRYVMHEAGATTPSHNPFNGWAPNEGFPTNEAGGTANQRDYQGDKHAQQITQAISNPFDGRAYQDVPVISMDGVVYSGNGREMGREMAARQGTDGPYIETMRKYGDKYGFTSDNVDEFEHATVSFELDKQLPYTPEVFGLFNAQDTKGMSNTETAVALGKTVDDVTFNDVVQLINGFDTMAKFYEDDTAPTEAITLLLRGGVITPMQHAQMFDGDKVSAQGKEMLENLLLGKAFEGNPNAIRQLMDMPSVRRQVVVALAEIANNSRLGNFSLEDLLSQAIDLVHKARNAKDKVKQGESVLIYAKRLNLFPDITGGASVADINNTAMLMIADILNDHGTNTLKYVLTKYNYSAGEAVGMAGSLFIDESPEGILQTTIEHINELSNNELKKEINAAVEQRKAAAQREADSGQEAATADAGSDAAAGEPAGRESDLAQAKKELKYQLSDEVDENGRQFVLTSDGNVEFGEIGEETGLTPAPILLSEGMITNPDTNDGYGLVHIEARHGDQIRNAGYNSVVEFIEEVAKNYEVIREGKNRDGMQTYMLQLTDKHNNTLMVELSGDGTYWNINTAGIFKTSYGANRNVVYNRHTTANQPAEAGEVSQSEAQSGTTSQTSMNTPTQQSGDLSGDKGTQDIGTEQEKSAKSDDAAVASAEAEVETEPTEGQKEAGNYKKGHVKIDGFDVTIEQPKGSVRSGVDASGKPWSQEMHNTYGYIRGTEGVDGDHIDMFLSDHIDDWNGMVYVVDQVKNDGSFDEHKVMYGFDSEQEARDAYLSNYEEGWTGLGNITGITQLGFKKWINSSRRKTKAFADYKVGGIQGLEDYSEAEMLGWVRDHFNDVRETNDADAELVDVVFIGSRVRGDADNDSDLDVLLEFKGGEREDDMFSMLNEEPISVNGIEFDINPIKAEKSGTITEWLEDHKGYRKERDKADNADTASAHETAPQAENEMKPVEEPSLQPYTITPTKYTTKKGKELDVWLVKFDGEIDKQQATDIAKETRGWWDREQGGFLMRSEEAARDLAERVAGTTSQSDALPEPTTEEANKAYEAAISAEVDHDFKMQEKYGTPNWADQATEEDLAERDRLIAEREKAINTLQGKKTAETGNKQAETGKKTAKTESKREKVTGKRSAYVNSQIDVIARELASRDVVQGTVEAMPREGDLYAPFFDWVQDYIVKNYADLQSPDHIAVLHEFFGHKDWSPKENTDRTFKALSDLIKRTKEIIKQNKQAQAAASENASKPASEGPKRIVSDDRMAELKARLRNKLGGQLNVGIDPELLAIGAELTVGHIERGLTKFADYAKAMLEDVGDVIRPYLKSFYNAVRDMPEAEAYAGELTPYDEVRQFDIANFDKEGPKDVVATAKSIVDEQKAEQDVGTIRKDEVARGDLKLRPATEEDIEAGKQLYHNGEPVFAVMVTHQGHQTDSFQFTKPRITSVLLTNGKYVDPSELQVAEETEAKKAKKTSKNKKKDVSSQGVGSLFDLEPAEEETNQPSKQEENESERTNELRPEGLPADSDNEGEPTSRLGQTPGQEGRGSDRGGDSSRGGGLRENLHDGLRHADQLESPSPKLNQSNNHAQRGKDYAPKDVDARIEANIAAIELMQKLIESGKKATPKEMSVLRKFSGWGGLGKAFNDSAYGWREDGVPNRLRKLLGEEGYQQAIDSRLSAYYTPAKIIDALWDIARALGFKGGNVLEGSAGIGNIIGLMPTDMSERSQIHAVEIDGTTGNILSLLYPDAKVEIQGFEDTRVQNGTVDLAITNVPFVTGLHVIDSTGDKDLSKRFRNIHDFCIAKNVRKLREGGIGIFITSSGTLDNSQKLRDWLVSEGNADVVGAFRMNNATFGGTGTTSDIIVVRKRVNGQKSANAIDVSTVTGARTVDYETGEFKTVKGKQVPETKPMSLDYNRYFVEHPEMMGGEMAFAFEKGETYRETSKALYPKRGINQDERLAGFISSLAEKDWSGEAPAQQAPTEQAAVYEELGEGVKEGSMLIDSNGKLCVASYGRAVPLDVNDNKIKGRTKQQCFKDYCAIKDAVNAVLDYQTEHDDDAGLQPLLDKLNKVFDDFVSHYGHFQAISGKPLAISFLRNDMDFSSIAALESKKEYNDEKNVRQAKYTKGDIFTKRVVKKEAEPKPTTVKDGVITSIYKFGRVDVPYISEQLGKGADEVKDEIIASGLGFENPLSREVEVSYEYLSGNVREKLRQAHENNEDGRYDANIKALEAVIPRNIPAHLIEFTLGSSWLDPKLYSDFISERTGVKARVALIGGTWIVDVPGYYFTEQNRAMGVESKMCDKVIYGHELMAAALQNKTVRVSKTTKYRDGHSETIVDKEATQACSTKIDEIRQDFKDWAREKMQSDPDMSAQVEEVYNESFNNYVPREIPDSFVPEYFGGAARHIKLRPHQAKAAIRATTQNVMLAHEVGTGKTFTLITTAMEMRRLGTARKPMIVVQNATVGQFVASAKVLYPKAKVLTLEDADRTAEGRKAFYAKIKYNDWDMIVIPQSAFEMIPDSEERQMNFVRDKIEEKMLVLEQMAQAGMDTKSLAYKQAEREVEKLEEELNLISSAASEKRKQKDEKRAAKTRQNAEVAAREMLDRKVDDVEDFDQMGIDAILVDEAHEYKHLGFATAMQRGVKGVDPSYSKKSQGVFLKCQSVMERTGGKNVVFATGTPISNTAAEIWTFMRYLYPAETLKDYGIYYFDDFVRNFGNITQMLEFATNGKFKENNRFAGYVNLPELVRIWSGVADIVRTDEASNLKDEIPEMEGGKAQDIYLPQTRALRSVMRYVNARLEEYDKMSGKEKKANSHIPLTMYGIAKAAAVDARLVLNDAEDEPNSKTNEAVRQTLRTLEETADYRGTVAIFADNYQNKDSGFNLYEDIRKKLIAQGVPEDQIVVMKSGMSVKKKLEIFDKVNAGEIRVIMGSTFTLGTGVNIQERLHTLIHVDAPNRPMDYTQRNGRILRQGNLHKQMGKPVRVLRFGVEDSLDVTAYQRLKTKGAIADSIMHGKQLMSDSMANRTMEEDEDVFGDVVAQLSGSEYALLKNQAEREVRKLEAKRKQWEADQIYIHSQKPRLAGYIKASRQAKEEAEAALKALEGADLSGGITIGLQHFNSADEMGDFIKEYNKKITEDMDRIRKSFMSEDTVREMTMTIGGFDFNVRTVMARDTERRGTSLNYVTRRSMSYTCDALGLTAPVPVKQGLLRNAIEDIMENVLTGKDARERIEAAESSITRNEQELAMISEREGRPFEQADELQQARAKLKDYEQKMKAELEAKESKYAEMDASVDEAKPISIDDEDDELYREDQVRVNNAQYSDYTDERLRDVLSEGGNLAIMENNGKWRIEGMPGEFNTRYSAIDEWRERAAGNVMWYFSEDGNSIVVEGEGDLYETMSRTSTTSDRRYRERLARQQEARVKRGRQMVDELANKLGITVRYVDDMSADERAALGERKLNSKGWYSPRTGEVYINLGRHTRLYDMEATFLHEVVAHKGLRRLFGKDFDTFIDNIYNNVNKGIRAEIDRMAEQQKSRATDNQRARHDDGHWRRVATEEYMARLAERLNLNHPEERTIWEKIREYVIDKLRKIGVHLAESLSDNDLRGLLWESYHSMEMEGVVGVAKGKVFRDQMEREANNGRTAPVHETAIAAEPAAQYTGTLFDMITPQAGAWQRMMSNMSERELFKEISQDGPNVTSSYTDEYDRRHIKDYNRACDEIQARLERELPYADRLLELLQDATRQWEDGAYKDERRSGVLAAIDTISRALDEEGAELPSVEDESLYRDEEDIAQANEKVNTFKERYNIREDIADIRPIDGEDALNRAISEQSLNKNEAKELRAKFDNPESIAVANAEKGFVYVFTHKIKDLNEVDLSTLHELVHIAYPQLSQDEIRRFTNAIVRYYRSYPKGDKFINKLHASYDSKDWATETMAYFIEKRVKKHGWEKLFSGEIDFGNEEINNFVRRIHEILTGNGTEGTEQNGLGGAGSTRGGSQRGNSASPGNQGGLNAQLSGMPDDDVDVDGFDAGRMTFEESITAGMLKASADNRAAVAARTAAMRALGGNLSKLRQAMARQREYDRGTVDSIVRLARSVIESGYFKGFSPYEVKRLMSLINHAAGREDITRQAGKVVDLLLKHQLLSCEVLLHDQMRTRGSKINASGVEVQAGLDIEGQRMVAAMKYAINLDADAMQERIWDALDRMGSADQALADVAAAEYQGLLLAQQYIEDIKGSKQEENDLRYDLQQAEDDMRAGTITREQYRQYVAETENAIRENRLERVGAYDRLTTALGIGLNASVERAKEWREAQKERVNEIRHNANSDLEGIPADEHVKPSWMQQAANWSIVRFFMKPLANFDYMLRMLGRKNVNGEGYLWQRFMGGWTDAADSEWRNLKADHNVLDEKVSEVFGKDMRWSDLFTLERKLPGMDVSFWDAGEQKIHTLSQGNMLYIYMVNKMSDGRMKLRKMGITEDDVEVIRQQLDPRFIQLADWLQEEFLVNKRNDYNKVYQRMFGASMAAIEHYFPLKINSRSRGQEEDLSSERYLDDNNIGSTITGSIIKRKRNSLPLDVTGADAFDVVLGHLQDMEHWAAFAEFNRDLNTLLSYKRFRNRLLNMNTLRFGSGKTLWMNFKRTCAIASGAYRPKMDRDSVDTTLVNVAKGVTAAKISFRLYTAMKQLLSYPAYLSEASGLELIKSSNPIGAVKAWNWALAELPGFAQRWQSRQAGDSRLRESDADWGLWRNKIVSTASRLGMSPNAFIDGLTVAMGAKAIYESKLKRYRKAGYTDEQAKRRALRDASISYNETQQSNANAYLSAMQLDRSAASVALTVFRNASMGYQRRLFQSIANLKHIFTPGYKEQALEFMTKQMVRDGLDEQQAQQAAARVYRRATYKNLADFAIFGWVMQMAWNLGPYLPYLLMGDDDDDKKKMLEDAAMHALAGGIEGLSGGNVMSDTYNAFRSGQVTSYMSTELLPLMSDIEDLKRKLNQDMVEGAHDLVNLIVQAGVGVNPQQITDWLAAGLDVADGDPEIAHEFGMFVLRFMSVPQSQLDKLYIDELGLTARDAQQLNATQMAERYARYKMRRGSMYTSWAYSDEGKQKAEERYLKRFETKVKERIAELGDEQLEDNFNTDDALRRKLVSQEANTRIKAKVMEGVVPAEKGDDEGEWKKVYERKRDYTDLAQDILLTATRSRAKKEGNTNLDKAIAAAQRELTTIKKGKHTKTIDEPGLGEGFDDDVMQRLRERRRELLKELGIM